MLSFAEGGQSFSQSLLPPVTTAADYIHVQADAELFVPAVQAICRRHGLSTEALVRLGEGTNVVFALGDHCIVKLFPPYWRQPFRAERAVSEHIYNRLSVTTPQVYAHGDLEGWPYLVMTRLRGRYFKDVWKGLDESAQLRLAMELGRLLPSCTRFRLTRPRTSTPTGFRSYTRGCAHASSAIASREFPSAGFSRSRHFSRAPSRCIRPATAP